MMGRRSSASGSAIATSASPTRFMMRMPLRDVMGAQAGEGFVGVNERQAQRIGQILLAEGQGHDTAHLIRNA
jgi:hypothetical protein